MICNDGKREIRLCQDPEETFHLDMGLCLKGEAHCLERVIRTRRWNGGGIIDTGNLDIKLYQVVKEEIHRNKQRFTRSLASPSETVDVLQDVECEKDPEGYIVPDPHHCNR